MTTDIHVEVNQIWKHINTGNNYIVTNTNLLVKTNDGWVSHIQYKNDDGKGNLFARMIPNFIEKFEFVGVKKERCGYVD